MWRINFNAKQGRFCIQFLFWTFFWRSVRDEGGAIHYFKTYTQARDHAECIGLAEAFYEQATKGDHHWLGQGARHPKTERRSLPS